jgi:DNA-binding transcriptional MerR regulator/methylmalonyl-CoA mutase cobalamin-binding subunit
MLTGEEKMKKAEYPIKAVSKLTRLSADTLRAWERRYEAIKPDRSGQRRTYTESDISRLNLLRRAVESGHNISGIASLSDEELKRLAERSIEFAAVAREAAPESAASDHLSLQPVIDAIERFDYADAERELNRLALLVSSREFVRQVVIPLMGTVGDRWYHKTLSIAQEHLTSAILRNLLGSLVRLYSRASSPATIVLATPTGEHHEFGVLSAAMLAAGGGLGIVYLGADLPAREIVDAAIKTESQAVVLGLKGAGEWKESINELQQVSKELPEKIELWIGGMDSQTLMRQVKKTRAVVLSDFDALEKNLMRLGAKF